MNNLITLFFLHGWSSRHMAAQLSFENYDFLISSVLQQHFYITLNINKVIRLKFNKTTIVTKVNEGKIRSSQEQTLFTLKTLVKTRK